MQFKLLTARFGRHPNELEISQVLAMDLAAYQRLVGDPRGLGISALVSERFRDPLSRYAHAETHDRLAAAILKLPARERLVMTLYYYEESTMKEIGLILDVLEARASQIHTSAGHHLREELSRMAHGKGGKPDAGSGRRLRSYSYPEAIAARNVDVSGIHGRS
jgi:RNA polymerase sigma factor for flagellar operon FliA